MDTSPSTSTFARNLRRLIERDFPPGERVSVRAWATSRDLEVKMIDRLSKGQNSPTVETLDKIAAACGLQAWQLLLEDFDPAAPPSMPITPEERKTLANLRRLLDAE